MSESTTMLIEAASKLFADLCTKQALDAAESAFPRALWTEVEAAGFPAMLAPEADGGIDASPPDAVEVLRVAGRHSVPLPLVETMIGRWLLSRGALPAIPGPLALALGTANNRWRLEGVRKNRKLYGKEEAVPWGVDATACIMVVEEGSGITLGVIEPASLKTEARRNIAGEPRDRLVAGGVTVGQAAHLDKVSLENIFCMAALLRGAMIVGALQQVLDLCVRYTQERVQFGRPLSRFQAIQQQLAVLAGSVAASAAITDAAAATIERKDGKLMVAAARARLADAIDTATGIAHQVHGAIGFAREYALHFSTRRLWAWRDEYGTAVQWREHVGRTFAGTGADSLWPALAAVGSK